MVTDVQQQECLGKLLPDRDLLDPNFFQCCSVGLHYPGKMQWCQLSPSSAHHRHTKPVWPNVTSEATGLPQQFMNLSTISISSHQFTQDSTVFGLLPLTSGTPFSLPHSETASLALNVSLSSNDSRNILENQCYQKDGNFQRFQAIRACGLSDGWPQREQIQGHTGSLLSWLAGHPTPAHGSACGCLPGPHDAVEKLEQTVT